MLAWVRPRDIAARRRIAAGEMAELVTVGAKMRKATAKLNAQSSWHDGRYAAARLAVQL
jgi:hypothetical protein